MTLAERNFFRDDINCPGDTILYRCSIASNSETVQLTWLVTLPGMVPVNITYDNTSIPNTVDTTFGNNITTTLTNFTVDLYTESTIMFTVLRDVVMNGTMLECISGELAALHNFFCSSTVSHTVYQRGTILQWPCIPLHSSRPCGSGGSYLY